jgi:hypothetical protein
MIKEFIVRLREAAAQRVASTAMIGADDLIAAADALESLGADRDSWERQAGDRLDDVLRVVAERDALAAELKVLLEQEPVARIDDDESFQGPCRHAMAFVPMHRGSPLYAYPVPARELTDADIALCIASADKSFAQERISGKPVLGVWSKHLARAIERYLRGEGK